MPCPPHRRWRTVGCQGASKRWASHQKSVVRPPNAHSDLQESGSFFGPPTSPVSGLVSPSKSAPAPLRASGCRFSSPSSVLLVNGSWSARAGQYWSTRTPCNILCLSRTSRSNSRCSSAGSGCGPGRENGLSLRTRAVVLSARARLASSAGARDWRLTRVLPRRSMIVVESDKKFGATVWQECAASTCGDRPDHVRVRSLQLDE